MKWLTAVLAVVAALALAGCGAPGEVEAGSPVTMTATVTETVTATVTAAARTTTPPRAATPTQTSTPTTPPTPEPEPEPDYYSFSYECGGPVGQSSSWEYEELDTLEEVWAYDGEIPMRSCTVSRERGDTMTEAEREALISTGYEDPTERDLRDVYELCGETDGFLTMDLWLTPEHAQEMRRVLALCPGFPHADLFSAAVAEVELAEQQFADGTRIEDDTTHIVGDTIYAGTWVVEQSRSNCYWERRDSAGNIIDNNFIPGQTRVQVTIRASDYSFFSENCGEWVFQGG